MERLVIRKFRQLENVTVEVKDFIVFIGPQASGKSTIAKLIFCFKSIISQLRLVAINKLAGKDISSFHVAYQRSLSDNFHKLFGDFMSDESIDLSYSFNEQLEIKAIKNADGLRFSFSSIIDQRLKKAEKDILILSNKLTSETESSELRFELQVDFLNNILPREDFGDSYVSSIIYIPSGRSLITIYPEAYTFSEEIKSDPTLKSFTDNIDNIKNVFGGSLQYLTKRYNIEENRISSINIAIKKINSILKGEYQYDNNGGKLIVNDKTVQISNASSGQQESLWILLLIYHSLVRDIWYRRTLFIIEEPEAHLFPEAQVEIAELIALLLYESKTKVIVTTHSPYILAGFNSLIYAYQKGQIHREEVLKIIPEELWLDINRVYAGYVDKGGVENIIDHETNMIINERVDTASQSINKNFDALFELD